MRASTAIAIGLLAASAIFMSKEAIAQSQVSCTSGDSALSRPSDESILCWDSYDNHFYLNAIPSNGPGYNVSLVNNSIGGSTMTVHQVRLDGTVGSHYTIMGRMGTRTSGDFNVSLGGMPWVSLFFETIKNLPDEMTAVE